MKTSTYQTDAPSTSLWNLSLTSQQRWPVMCSVNLNKTIKLVLSPHAKSDRTAYEIWKALSAGVTELDVLFLLDICWTFHSHTRIPTVTRFSLWTHHLLTHRLTSLTLQCEGVAASMNHWLVGESSLSSVCVFEMDFFLKFLSVVLKTPIQIIMTLHCVYESVSCIWGRTGLLWQCIHWLGEKVCVCERQRMWTSSRSFLSVTEGTELLSLSGLIVSH